MTDDRIYITRISTHTHADRPGDQVHGNSIYIFICAPLMPLIHTFGPECNSVCQHEQLLLEAEVSVVSDAARVISMRFEST